jgi:hypothetical protein
MSEATGIRAEVVEPSEGPEAARLEEALKVAPRGAMALAALAVAVLMLCWLLIYFFAFIPRGTVG